MTPSLLPFLLTVAVGSSVSATVLEYSFSGEFSSSKWNADSSNATRSPGGPFSGVFSIDTATLSLVALEIDSTFYSLYGPVVSSGTFNFGIDGMDDDSIGNATKVIGAASFGTRVGLTVDLSGAYDPDGDGGLGSGSVIQVLDRRLTSSRAYFPRLTIFMEGIDFSSTAPASVTASVTEEVWNFNRGNGRPGYSGTQDAASVVASTLSSIPEPASFGFGASVLVFGFGALRRRRG